MSEHLRCEGCAYQAAATRYRKAFHVYLCPACNQSWKDQAYLIEERGPVAWAFDMIDA